MVSVAAEEISVVQQRRGATFGGFMLSPVKSAGQAYALDVSRDDAMGSIQPATPLRKDLYQPQRVLTVSDWSQIEPSFAYFRSKTRQNVSSHGTFGDLLLKSGGLT